MSAALCHILLHSNQFEDHGMDLMGDATTALPSVLPCSGVSEAQRILQEGVDMTSSSWATRWLPGSLLPPFTATASIIGQHITTFDLHHYQFLGPCSYLLTQDFVGGDFSVVGVYQAEAGVVGLASVEVHTPSGTFVMGVNGSVDTSQSQHEVHSAGGRTSLKVGGLLVSCDQTLQGCLITVSNKYFGRSK
ncbi:Apolipophorin [Portunus trituberculatus]|uniref:Apolipophorin n=1 Tax=Portunus trituberculatus TaxID=210409 RepID=A0A5B7HBB9_PORTR|nr:Apolipophorin [Portunus trituberculatus]